MSGLEIVTFGCRLNAYESEAIRVRARQAGLSNAVIVNTCAVTAEAVRQSRQAIRKLKRERPDAPIIVTGCAADASALDNSRTVSAAIAATRFPSHISRTELIRDVRCSADK